MSAGTQFHSDFYAKVHQSADAAIARFWKNRLTLMRFGKLFSRNLFRNLARLPDCKPLPLRCITKPILVLGAGTSCDEFLLNCREKRLDWRRYFVVAVDTALPPLLNMGITPDLVIQLECQFAIEQAYYTAAGKSVPLAFDLASRPAVFSKLSGDKYCFLSAFTDASFIERAALLSPLVLPPLGSVGIAALWLALRFRASDTVPVFVCGLDFAYPAGKSHCRASPAHTQFLRTINRLKSDGMQSTFSVQSARVCGKNGAALYSEPALLGYRDSFAALFAGAAALYDVGNTGLALGIPQATVRDVENATNSAPIAPSLTHPTPIASAKAIGHYYKEEKSALEEIRLILTGEQSGGAADSRLHTLLCEREYLYLHFPDGDKFPHDAMCADLSFLKRVRGEIDVFLKDIAYAQKILQGV
jgi:hypothetical protein